MSTKTGKTFSDQIMRQLNSLGLIYGGGKKAHYTLSLLPDGNGPLYADRVELYPSPAGSADLIAEKVGQLGYRHEKSASSVTVYRGE